MKVFKLITKIVLSLLAAVFVFVIASAIHLSMIRTADLNTQKIRMDKVKTDYKDYTPKGYLDYSDENLDDYYYNEVSFLASHNSYKKKGSLIGKLFVGLGDSFSEAKSLNYSYKPLTDQLKNGIFSFELDIRLRKDNFEITHVPLVDNSSNAVNFKLALEEIKLFLDNEPNSFPILVLLEIKDDYMFLDPFLRKIGIEQLKMLENEIANVLGNYLYSPKDMVGLNNSLMDKINNEGWPKVSELKRKVMFLIHAGKYANLYNDEIDLTNQLLFTSSYNNNLNSNMPFVINNSLDVRVINDLVNQNYMVRTRVGNTLSYSDEDVKKALESKAQILTSDFLIARLDLKDHFYFENNKTIRLIKSNNKEG